MTSRTYRGVIPLGIVLLVCLFAMRWWSTLEVVPQQTSEEPSSKRSFFPYAIFEEIRSQDPKTQKAELVIDLAEQDLKAWRAGQPVVEDTPPVAGILEDYDNDGRKERALPVRIVALNGKTEYSVLLATLTSDGRWKLLTRIQVDSLKDVTDIDRLKGFAEAAFTASVAFPIPTPKPDKI